MFRWQVCILSGGVLIPTSAELLCSDCFWRELYSPFPLLGKANVVNEANANYRTNLAAFVLAGGGSRRFGSDKALALVPGSGQTFLDRCLDQIGQLTTEIAIVAPADRAYDRPNINRVTDRFPGEGPLGGIISALDSTVRPICLIVSCDQIHIDPLALNALVSALDGNAAVCFSDEIGRLNPLPVALSRGAFPKLLASFLRGERQLRSALEQIGTTILPTDDIAQLRDVDRPGDLVSAFHST
jgi:molybdenum cofactor guanylyltransferase